MSEEMRDEMVWGLSAFFVGEERVTSQFSGLVLAAEDKHEEAFLLTQQVDEARHAQHFNRLYEEVFQYDGSFDSSVIVATSPCTVRSSKLVTIASCAWGAVFGDSTCAGGARRARRRGPARRRRPTAPYRTVSNACMPRASCDSGVPANSEQNRRYAPG